MTSTNGRFRMYSFTCRSGASNTEHTWDPCYTIGGRWPWSYIVCAGHVSLYKDGCRVSSHNKKPPHNRNSTCRKKIYYKSLGLISNIGLWRDHRYVQRKQTAIRNDTRRTHDWWVKATKFKRNHAKLCDKVCKRKATITQWTIYGTHVDLKTLYLCLISYGCLLLCCSISHTTGINFI